MQTSRQAYRSEEELVDALLSALRAEHAPWGELTLAQEFAYESGRTDIIGVDTHGNVVAFEAKLTRWRDALQQAYRNTSFAHLSYVVVPEETAQRAERSSHEFHRRSVGLCYLSQGCLVVPVRAVRQDPVAPWLSSVARAHVSEGT